MVRPSWLVFAATSVIVASLVIGLARTSAAMLRSPASHRTVDLASLGSRDLILNVVVSHGLLGAVIVGAALFTGVPWATLGLGGPLSATHVALGLGAGVAFAAVAESLAHLLELAGLRYDAELRRALRPNTIGGWLLLVCIGLPVAAVVEELIFRAALVGAIPAGLGVSQWVMAVVSSLGFGFAHGVQGRIGVLVTGLLGFGLAAVFVATESLVVVVVIHYVINVVEFLIHEFSGGG